MNELYLTSLTEQKDTRELRRMRCEREHPDGFSQDEIRAAIGDSASIRMRLQTIISNISNTQPSAPSRRTQPKPIGTCSPQI